MEPHTNTTQPITTTNSIIAAKYNEGILVISDMAVNYGSNFKFANVSHFAKLSPTLLIGATGEYSDFQELRDYVVQEMSMFEARTGGDTLTPAEVHTYIKRILYQKRSKMNPLMLRVVTAGVNPDHTFFLATADQYGTSWEDPVVYTGMAHYLHGNQVSDVAGKEKDTVNSAIHDLLKALAARHSTQTGKLEMYDIRVDGITRTEEAEARPNWDIIEE